MESRFIGEKIGVCTYGQRIIKLIEKNETFYLKIALLIEKFAHKIKRSKLFKHLISLFETSLVFHSLCE